MTCLTTELTHPEDRHMNDYKFGLGLWHTSFRRYGLHAVYSLTLTTASYDVYLVSLEGKVPTAASVNGLLAADWLNSGKGFQMHQSLSPIGKERVRELNNESLGGVREYLLKMAYVHTVLDLCP